MTTATAISEGKPTVAVHFTRLLTDYCAMHGLAVKRLLNEVGLPPDALDDVDGRLPFADYSRMMDYAAESMQDPNLGLHLGQAIRPGHFGAHGLSMLACSSIRELVPRMVRYAALIHEACRDEVEERDGQWILNWRSNLPGNADPGRHHSELNFADALVMSSWLTGVRKKPLWVSFRHSRPANVREHEIFFECPLRFGAADNAIAFPVDFLDLPLLQPNPPVLRMMDTLCDQLLRKLHAGVDLDWLNHCKKAIVDALRNGTPELESIAAVLRVSPRHLRRQLAEHHLNFRDLVDDLRRELAKRYVEDPSLSLVDIAFLLGFSEQSAFQRAFRRWTGEAPGRLRRTAIQSNRA